MNIEEHKRLSEQSRHLSKIYEEDGDYEKALYHCEKMASHIDAIFNAQHCEYINAIDIESIGSENYYRKMFADMDNISDICRSITANFDFEDMISDLTPKLKEILKIDSSKITIFENLLIEDGTLFSDIERHIADSCVKSKKGIMINDIISEAGKSEIGLYRGVGEQKPGSLIYMPLILHDQILGLFGIQSDDTNAYDDSDFLKMKLISEYISISLENSKYYNEKNYHATHDYLTGMLNRKELLSIGNTEFRRFKKEGRNISVIIIDADGFKNINDKYGHMAGDLVIVKISEVICANIRNVDYAGRHGGEEFMIILSDTSWDVASKIAERIRLKLEKSRIILDDGKILRITASFGIFQFDEDTQDFESGVIKADQAMYIAKKNGKNRVHINHRQMSN
ncbi:sensor domain-containing diguanylate cyclase [Proteocatella sphenisci]|uniref:sensor domain-containing diguanylate cyclase n=1 Tax=Proteocatella sphenisci TaxID=181070 RepID=UPI00048ADC2F|nr:sensor domain-containing diguanylate cyclase [Proteocatella sphenisci]